MNRFLILLICLLIRVVALAQPVAAINTPSRSATEPTTPGRINATESPVYIKVYGLYGFLTPGVQISHGELQSPDGSVFTFKTTNKGLGAGLRAGAGIGIIVSDFINLGIDADMLFGSDLKISNSYNGGDNTYTSLATTTLKVVSVIPNITFKALSRPAYYIYNRLGLVGGIVLDYKSIDAGDDIPKVGVATTSSANYNYTKNSLALGYQAALGIQFRLSQNLRGFAEVVAYNQSFKPKRLEFSTTSNISGQPVTSPITTTEFTDQGILVGASNTQTGQLERFNVSMNSIGIGVGLSFRF
ncbi:hypothetical protein [Spirosoma pollinicola]|nr:hypothetical protein [Spirosoma pollinicola]